MSEETLWIIRARQGDQQAFLHLLELHQRPIYNLCYRMLGQAEEAEDAMQETFLRAYRSLSRYDPKRPFASWLLSIAAHHCIDRLRRKRELFSLDDPFAPDLADPSLPDPQEAAEKREQSLLVQHLLSHLAPLDRAIVILRYWHELPEAEIGRQLGLSTSAVKSRLHRARRALARLWMESIPSEREIHEASLVRS